jgi:hypothetical protein
VSTEDLEAGVMEMGKLGKELGNTDETGEVSEVKKADGAMEAGFQIKNNSYIEKAVRCRAVRSVAVESWYL